jgi:putative glutamine amidotransferase
MTQLPLIGITTYHRNEKGYVQLPGQYADAVRRAGGLPLLIQPGEPKIEALLSVLDGIILSGGGDVDPALYTKARHQQVYWVDKERDQFEIALIKHALAVEKPLFCICRGMQLLNVALGGTLILHLADAVDNAIAHRQPPRDPINHDVEVDPDSRLARAMKSAKVNTASWHHQAIDRAASGLKAIARAADGVIEALEMPGHPLLFAVQWHPELTAHADGTQQLLFDEFVKNAAQGKASVSRGKT